MQVFFRPKTVGYYGSNPKARATQMNMDISVIDLSVQGVIYQKTFMGGSPPKGIKRKINNRDLGDSGRYPDGDIYKFISSLPRRKM